MGTERQNNFLEYKKIRMLKLFSMKDATQNELSQP